MQLLQTHDITASNGSDRAANSYKVAVFKDPALAWLSQSAAASLRLSKLLLKIWLKSGYPIFKQVAAVAIKKLNKILLYITPLQKISFLFQTLHSDSCNNSVLFRIVARK